MKKKPSRSPSNPQKRIRSWEELARAAQRVQDMADKKEQPVALTGGFALQLLGSTRLTSDVDFVAYEPIPGLKSGRTLRFGGYMSKAEGVPVDVIIRIDEYEGLYQEALENFERYSLGELDLYVIEPEYIAAMKMAAGRLRDLADLEFLIGEKKINLQKTREIIHRHLGVYAAQEDWPQIVQEVNWRRRK